MQLPPPRLFPSEELLKQPGERKVPAGGRAAQQKQQAKHKQEGVDGSSALIRQLQAMAGSDDDEDR